MSRRNPFKRQRFPREVILLAMRWYYRYPLSFRDVRDMLAERGVAVDGRSVPRRRVRPDVAVIVPLQRQLAAGIIQGS